MRIFDILQWIKNNQWIHNFKIMMKFRIVFIFGLNFSSNIHQIFIKYSFSAKMLSEIHQNSSVVKIISTPKVLFLFCDIFFNTHCLELYRLKIDALSLLLCISSIITISHDWIKTYVQIIKQEMHAWLNFEDVIYVLFTNCKLKSN